MAGAVEVRAKFNAALRDFPQLIETENLESARIGENTALPRHEPVQPAQFADDFMSGSQIEVIGVAQQNLDAKFLKNVLRNALDGPERPHRHKDRCLDFAVRSVDTAQSRSAIGLRNGKEKRGHSRHCIAQIRTWS